MSRLLPSLPDPEPDDRDPRVVGVDDEEAEELLAALGSETARNVLSTLHERPATTSELADELDTSLQNVQYHLSNLKDADVVDVIDTTYSEKGREMNVYAPADEPLVLFAGSEEQSSGIKTALKRLLGGYALLGVAAFAVQRLAAMATPDATAERYTGAADGDDAGGGSGDGGDVGIATTEPDASPEEPTVDAEASDGVLDVAGDLTTDLLTDPAAVLAEPGVVFFLGAALVFSLGVLYWYRRGRTAP
ncbi:Helix-turn-helix domain-containing protein [Halorubrum aquaticum]|uniref:Helix-turn-helix domain-containing protein n=1 Tax=Halorubrum aquaticum TaxID=387340 RepID=A0A1I2Z654_9EURY|nr:winged helix-turn-helix domain-containing protein [Halorubrum aquaticum]SFH32976.1 Helix-turn-helix domain-containing protein [Halorubrum aquaticum]